MNFAGWKLPDGAVGFIVVSDSTLIDLAEVVCIQAHDGQYGEPGVCLHLSDHMDGLKVNLVDAHKHPNEMHVIFDAWVGARERKRRRS